MTASTHLIYPGRNAPSWRPAAVPAVDSADAVFIFPYDPAWPIRFRIEAQLLRVVLADLQPQIEHIGSTAVPELAAKPIIDILVGVSSLERFMRHGMRLASYGYDYVPAYETSLPNRRFFKRVVDGVRTHHVHVVEAGGKDWTRYLQFRDSLRSSPELAADYARLKHQLALRHRHDRDAYTAGKSSFVEQALLTPSAA